MSFGRSRTAAIARIAPSLILIAALVGCLAGPSPSTSPLSTSLAASATPTSPSASTIASDPTVRPTVANPTAARPDEPTSSAAPPSAPDGTPALLRAVYSGPYLIVESWAPDGKHLVLRTGNDRRVIDVSGTTLFPLDADESAWVDAQTIVGLGRDGPDDAAGTVRLYDLSGAETGNVSTELESAVFAPGHRLFAGIYPAPEDLPLGDTFSIWDGSTLSAPQSGHPVAWSPDGTRLAVLLPPWFQSKPAMGGTLAIVDATGTELMRIDGWIADTVEQYAFSPDGRYLATMLRHSEPDLPDAAVIDTQTGAVTPLEVGSAYLDWTEEPTLYASGLRVGIRPWTAERGLYPDPSIGYDRVAPAPNGDLAAWSDVGYPSLGLVIGGQNADQATDGNVVSAQWGPDGTQLAVVTAHKPPDLMNDLTIISPREIVPPPPPPPSDEPVPEPTGYSVHIADGIHPFWTGQEAAAHVARMPPAGDTPVQILSVEAMRGSDVPRSIGGPDGELPIAWVVHASGLFMNSSAPSLAGFSYFGEAWFIFDDFGNGVGEALDHYIGPVYTPAPETPHPTGPCGPYRLNVVNESYLDVVVGINDTLGVTVEGGESYLFDEWETEKLTPPAPPWHVTIVYKPSNVSVFETTMYPPADQQLTITRDGVVQTPYEANSDC